MRPSLTKTDLAEATKEARRRMIEHLWRTNPIRLRGQGDQRFLDDDWRNVADDASKAAMD